MKKMLMTLMAMLTIAVSASAMSYEQARNEALFLTDKMAYELNLTDEQYEACYEINLDYLMGNEQVKRNIKRFPDDFMFQLTNEEWTILKSQITAAKQFENKAITLLRSQFATTKDVSKIRTLPYAFTRNGIGMLSSVLGSDTAVEMNIRQLNSFSCHIGTMIVFSLSMMTFISWVQVLKILVQVSVL